MMDFNVSTGNKLADGRGNPNNLPIVTDADNKDFYKFLTKNYIIDLATELRGKMSRQCGGDGSIEWVSSAGDDKIKHINHNVIVDVIIELVMKSL